MDMAKRKKPEDYCPAVGGGTSCRVESLVSVDERGQMVIPKDIREKAKIRPGDKLTLISWEKAGEFYCIVLIKTEELGEMIKEFLGPVIGEPSKT
jgi:AbrB family looped-hinge helix DNA binding protein